jgi:hypothetical protein
VAIIAGDVVIVSAANDESFTTTTSAAYATTRVGVALESIAAAAAGRILLEGYAPLVNVSASATRGHYLFTHTVAKQATSSATYTAGAFGQIIKAGTTPSAILFSVGQAGVAELAFGSAVRSAGDLTTTSASFVDVTSLTVTITTGAHRCRVTFVGVGYSNGTNTSCWDLIIDSTLQGNTLGLVFTNAGIPVLVGFSFITPVLTSAAHTFKIQWKSNSGQTSTLFGNTTTATAQLFVEELNLSS